jgi:small-conductance mechanosensitive channel
MLEWLTSTELWGNSVLLWLSAAGGALLAFLILQSVLSVAASRVQAHQAVRPSTARSTVLALLNSTRRWVMFVLALLLAAGVLSFVPRVEALISHLIFILVGFQIALWANSLIELWLQTSLEPGRTRINPVIATILGWAAQVMVWTVLLMFVLANLGVNITAFVASLGVGGIAVALAVQNILGDLFASASIGLDKPFEVGQFIAFGNDLGTVEHVGIKTTRIKSLSGEQLVISNTQLLNQLIRNYGRMSERRVVFGFRVPYGTPRERAQAIPARVRALLEQEEQVRFDRAHLANFGEFGLEFEVVYYVLSPDFTLYRDIQQRVNLGIMAVLEEFEVKFAVPARQVVVSGSLSKVEGADADETVDGSRVEPVFRRAAHLARARS